MEQPVSYVINVENETLLTRNVKVTQAEYFWDTDPGAGNGTVLLALDGNLDEAIENLFEGVFLFRVMAFILLILE